jgi:hypothetical protein
MDMPFLKAMLQKFSQADLSDPKALDLIQVQQAALWALTRIRELESLVPQTVQSPQNIERK